MGKFEKLVVLSVFLAAAVVLAVALNRGKAQLESSSPLRGAQEVLGKEKPAPTTRSGAADPATNARTEPRPPAPRAGLQPVGPEQGTSLLLNAGAEKPTPSPVEAPPRLGLEPVSNREHRILDSAAGLRPSFLDEFMLYTVAEGDTWSALAQRFYQDGRYTRNLQQANDGLSQLVPGKDILVPVFDFIEMDAEQQPEPGSSRPAAREAAPVAAPSTAVPSTAVPASSAPGTQVYVVRPGDTLSEISKAVFGTATRWQELLDANTDVLQKPEALQVGMKLAIPAGGRVPEGLAKVTDASTTRAKGSAKSADSRAEPRKSKVD